MGSLISRTLILLLCLLLTIPQLCLTAETGLVSWIYDGDTIEVDGIGKVRLIGIDVPESKDSPRDRYYQETFGIPPNRLRQIANRALQRNIAQVKGKRVRLEFDRQRHDRYGRTLAYVYLEDGTLLNLQLISEGLASVYRRFDFRMRREFLREETVARTAATGLWAL